MTRLGRMRLGRMRFRHLKSLLEHIARAPRLAARGLIKGYTYSFSALVGFHCRHLPTCSAYADEAISRSACGRGAG